MTRPEQIAILMADVGPVLDPLAIKALPEQNAWAVAMEEDLLVLVQLDEDRNCLVLSSELGKPPPGDRHMLYELLLQMNYHWETTGGNRMALDGPGGDVVQLFEIGADDLDASQLSGIVTAFANAAKAWREIVQRPAQAHASTLNSYADLGMRV